MVGILFRFSGGFRRRRLYRLVVQPVSDALHRRERSHEVEQDRTLKRHKRSESRKVFYVGKSKSTIFRQGRSGNEAAMIR